MPKAAHPRVLAKSDDATMTHNNHSAFVSHQNLEQNTRTYNTQHDFAEQLDDNGKSKNKTLTKAELSEHIHQTIGFSKKDCMEIVDIFFETIKEQLEDGEDVKVAGFGKFAVRYKHPRRGRNPANGDSIEISARRVLTFKPSQLLKDAVCNNSVGDLLAQNHQNRQNMDIDDSLDADDLDEQDLDDEFADDDMM